MLVHPQIDPIAFSLGPLAVRWYGLMYLAGFAAGWWLGTRRISQGLAPVTRVQFDGLLFAAMLGVILGGRLGYVLFYKPGYFASQPLEVFAIWEGGMSFHGGLLGVMLAAALVARAQKVDSSSPRPRGQVSALFLIGYGALRFLAEFAREPDAYLGLLALGLSMGQWLSLPMIAAGIALFWWSGRAGRDAPRGA